MTLRKNVMLLLTVKLAVLEFLRIASTSQNNLRNEGDFNTQAPVAQKISDVLVFRRFQGEGVEFC